MFCPLFWGKGLAAKKKKTFFEAHFWPKKGLENHFVFRTIFFQRESVQLDTPPFPNSCRAVKHLAEYRTVTFKCMIIMPQAYICPWIRAWYQGYESGWSLPGSDLWEKNQIIPNFEILRSSIFSFDLKGTVIYLSMVYITLVNKYCEKSSILEGFSNVFFSTQARIRIWPFLNTGSGSRSDQIKKKLDPDPDLLGSGIEIFDSVIKLAGFSIPQETLSETTMQ